MFIKESSIDEVKEADILLVVQGTAGVNLTKKGANYSGCCPLHGEKTPSFNVNPTKNMFKCFGCGAGGDAIAFVRQHDGVDFFGAVEKIARIAGIQLEYIEKDRGTYEAQRATRTDMRKTVVFAQNLYRELLWKEPNGEPMRYWQQRGFTNDTIAYWGLGWAPNEWRTLSGRLDDKDREAAVLLGLLKKGDEGKDPYDAFRGRVTVPITDAYGEPLTFGARIINKTDDKAPKYINGSESPLYSKRKTLFGLYQAQKSIREQKLGILVEGQLDVISMHQHRQTNTVGTCGSALTPEQAKIMMRVCNEWVLLRDGDNAGRKALLKDLHITIPMEIKAWVLVLPDGEDPDSFIRKMDTGAWYDYVTANLTDGFTWLLQQHANEAGEDEHKKAKSIGELTALLATVENEVLRSSQAKQLAKHFEQKLPTVEKMIKSTIDNLKKRKEEDKDEEADERLPEWAKDGQADLMRYGFVERTQEHYTGYYFPGAGGGNLSQRTNFVIKPLYHIYSQNVANNRRLMQVGNGYYTNIVEMPSKSMLSLDQAMGSLYAEGTYLPKDGFTKDLWLKILNKISDQFKMAHELEELGWQEEGFFAFYNKCYVPPEEAGDDGKMASYDDFGVVEIGEKNYLSPSKSKVNDLVRGDKNIYENDMYLKYVESSLDFAQWSELMEKVYGENAWMGIAWAVATLFRDIILHVTKIPHLYAYGAVGAGKSEYGESINNLFFSGKNSQGTEYKPMNLNQGTDFAFFNRYERFKNCPNWLNEFDEFGIPDNWFRAIKAAYDGEGRTKGQKEKNKATTQKINCTTGIMGQYLGTRDDNSVLTRSLPLAFRVVPIEERTEQEMKDFAQLKLYEQKGLSGILKELLDLRPLFKKSYTETFTLVQKQLASEMKAESVQTPTRIMKNVACMIAVVELVGLRKKLPFSKEDFYDYAKQYMRKLTLTISNTSGVNDFWGVMEYLLDRAVIVNGKEYCVETQRTVTLSMDDNSSQATTFSEDTKLLYLRLGTVHKLYMETQKKHGRQVINEASLLLYMKDQPYFVGSKKSHRFKGGINTSCYVFKYDMLGINLERLLEEPKAVELKGEVLTTIVGTALENTWWSLVRIYVKEESGIKEEVYKCFFTNMPNAPIDVQKGYKIILHGALTVVEEGNHTRRQVDVADYKCQPAFQSFEQEQRAMEEKPVQAGDIPF